MSMAPPNFRHILGVLGESLKRRGVVIAYRNDRMEMDFYGHDFKSFFLDEKRILKLRSQVSRRQPLIRAITTNRFRPNIVMDLTAGFGFDSILMAIFGLSVICVEKDPIIFLFLKEFLSRIGLIDLNLATRIRPIFGDSKEIIKDIGLSIPCPDVLYLDPMFSVDVKRRSREKKYMQVIRSILDNKIEDEDELFKRAMDSGVSRIVIKRYIKAKPARIMGRYPVYQVTGRGHRFDVYVK